MQGFLHLRPVPAGDFRAWLDARAGLPVHELGGVLVDAPSPAS